jgi:small subunit ribosomal protein S16
MPVRIRLSRGGAKKRPFYRIVVADSRRARDGKFIDQIGTYNPMLPKDSVDRVKMDVDKAKEWISKGAKPSDRISIFLSNLGVMDKPVITEKTKKHLPKKKTQERLAAAKEKEEAAKVAAEEPKAEEAKPAEEPKAEEAKPAEEPKAEEAKPAEEPKAEEAKPAEEPKEADK